MKFVLNGGLIIGTCDGANVCQIRNASGKPWCRFWGGNEEPRSNTWKQIEITREVGENNIFLFGNLAEDVEDLRHAHTYGSHTIDADLDKVFKEIEKGTFGTPQDFGAIIGAVRSHGDYYLVSDDFHSYI